MSQDPQSAISRRRFLALSSSALGLAGLGLAGCGGSDGEDDPKPEPTPEPIAPARNLLVYIADDWRSDVMSHRGHPVVRTPNFDRLASEGVSATKLFTVAMDCQPARVSLFSSLYAGTHGVRDNRQQVPDSILFLAEVLRDAGFATGGFGKLHDGTGAGQGLAETIPFTGANSPFYSRHIQWDRKDIESGRSGLDPRDCPTHTITEQGIGFVRRNANRRFFAVVSIPEPHPPYIAPDPYYSRVRPEDIAVRTFRENGRFWKGKHPAWAAHYQSIWQDVGREDLQRALATYYAKVEFLDNEFGRLRQVLENEGLLDETIVVVLGDHGEAAGLGGVMGKSGLMYDPVLGQPLVLRYPPLGAGRRLDALIENVDIAPTLLDLLGLPKPAPFEGQVSSRVLRGFRPLREDVITVLPYESARMVRTSRYKLIENSDGIRELYDLSQDPGEEDNIVGSVDAAVLHDLEQRIVRAR